MNLSPGAWVLETSFFAADLMMTALAAISCERTELLQKRKSKLLETMKCFDEAQQHDST